MKCIDELSANELKGKRVLLRAGLDLPLNDAGVVSDVYRLKRSLATIEFLSKSGARVIVITKVGRDPNDTTRPIAEAVKKFLPVFYVPALSGEAVTSAVRAMKDGEVILLENLQQDPREVVGDDSFARELASLGEIYVNDAFSSVHRESASIAGIPKFLPSYAGLLMKEEVEELNKARTPGSPSLAILGGAKFETKAPLIALLLGAYDHVFIAGALANDVFKARGFTVGRSLVSAELPDDTVLLHPNFLAPTDVTVESSDGHARVKDPGEVEEDDNIVDIGPKSVAALAPFIAEAKSILWSGPTGMYESGYNSYTHQITELIAKAAARGAKVVIGGGDTIAAIEASGVSQEKLGFLSTGGGAMLEYLLKGTLPGVEALK